MTSATAVHKNVAPNDTTVVAFENVTKDATIITLLTKGVCTIETLSSMYSMERVKMCVYRNNLACAVQIVERFSVEATEQLFPEKVLGLLEQAKYHMEKAMDALNWTDDAKSARVHVQRHGRNNRQRARYC